MKQEEKAIRTLRQLAIEEIDKANSGHPGIALGAAPIVHTLFTRHLKATRKAPSFIDRDRFVLAAGHASSLLYAILHLTGYDVSIDDLKNFRQLNSKTPGHPEVGLTCGVDASSGPLGQGIALGAGLAISEEYLANKFNTDKVKLIDHYTYVLCGDGDLQEGVTQEAMSLAGTLNLKKLIVLYDSNDIQLDGKVKDCNIESVKDKVKAMSWNYLFVQDGDDVEEINNCINLAKKSDKPTLIEIKTVIGALSSLAGQNKVHGSPLNKDEVKALRYELGGNSFDVDDDVYDFYYEFAIRRREKEYDDYINDTVVKAKEAGIYQEFERMINHNYDINFDEIIKPYNKEVATRVSNGDILKNLSTYHPGLIGGSSDVYSSTKVKGINGDFSLNNRSGRNILFGVREFAMATICNGIALHGMLRPFCGCFFVFSDYLKPAIRMAALMHLPVIYMFTHDSIAVGEDGATHEPIEQITMLRSIPNTLTFRPCDTLELKESWKVILNTLDMPSILILTRQDVKEVSYEDYVKKVCKGAYIARYETDELDGIILASGSEVSLAIDVKEYLQDEGKKVRVVSIPSISLFEKQTEEYKNMVIPRNIKNIMALEMDDATHLYKYMDRCGEMVNITKFGESGKAEDVVKKFGFTTSLIAKKYFEMVRRNKN